MTLDPGAQMNFLRLLHASERRSSNFARRVVTATRVQFIEQREPRLWAEHHSRARQARVKRVP